MQGPYAFVGFADAEFYGEVSGAARRPSPIVLIVA
jgi:hypothetical protein